MPGAVTATAVIASKVEPPSITREEDPVEMDLEQKETLPAKTKDEEPRDSQEDASPPVEIGEEAQAGEVGFKKVFKFVGCKFTVKKENPVKLEPVQLLTVKKDEDGEADGESKQEMGGLKNGDLSPAAHEAEGSPPEVLTPGETEESTDQVEPKRTAPEESVESADSPVESPAMDSPLKRFFRQGFFSVLRRKPSFKKAKDEPLVVGEKPEVNGEQVVAAGDVNGGEGDHGPSKEPSALQKDAEILGAFLVEERERDDDFEDLSVELAKVREAEERLMGKGSVSAVDDRQPCPEMKMAAPALDMGQAAQLTLQSPSAERPVKPEFAPVEVSAELQAGQTDLGPDRTQVKAPEPIVGEAELLSSQEKAKLQGSPLKKLFTSSSIKKLSGKKPKAAKGESKPGDEEEEARLQSSTESEGSPDGQKADTPPLTSPEEVNGTVPAETAEATNPEAEGMNGAADGERKKESITAWASFKKLVTSKKRPKVPSENDREDEQTDKVKSVAASSNESASAAPAELQEEAKLNAEDLSLERSTEDPKKKADVPVSWEALICVGSSKKRARKLSDSEVPQLDEELQRSPEAVAQVPDSAEELRASVPQDTDQEQGGTSPEGAVSSPVEGDVSDGAISTWESFKRLVTSRRKSKSKLEDRADESVAVVATEAAVPETEQQAKEESWASLKKLIPGRRKKRSDAKADQLPAEDLGKDTKQAEVGVSRSDDESDTPVVVPLSEYDAVEEERAAEEQQLTVGMNAVHKDELLTKSGAPAEGGELSAGQAITMDRGALESIRSSIDERSPSWISTAVSDIIEKTVEDEGKIVEEIMEAMGQPEHGDAASLADQARTVCPNEIAKEAQVSSEVAVALEYPAEESLTEETAEMVSAVSQLTETPVTTAESTPVPDDEVPVTRQTHEVLQEAAEKVKLSARPLAPPRKVAAAPEIPGSDQDSTEKVREEAVGTLRETEMSEPAGKGETGKSDAPSASEGTIRVADSESPQLERVEQTKCEMLEVSAAQSIESEMIPPPDDAAAVGVLQGVEGDAAHVSKFDTLLAEKIGEPLSLVDQTHAETACEVETGISEPRVKLVMDQTETGLETLEVSQAEDVLKTEAPLEKSKAAETSCREKVLTGDEEPIKAVTAEVPGRLEVKQLAECRDVTVGIPTESAEEATLEQTAIAEVARQMAVGNVEAVSEETIGNIHEIVEEVGTEERVIECRETLASTKEDKVEPVSEQSMKIIPANVEMNATAAGVCEESIGVTPVVIVTELCSEEMVQVGPDVSVSQVGLSEETIEVTPVITLMQVVSSEETVKDTSNVEVTEAELGEETKQTTPVVEVTEVLPGEQTTDKISPEMMTAVVCTEQTDASPVVTVTETVRGEETDSAPPVAVVMETVRGEETVGVGPVAMATETVCSEETDGASPVATVTEMVRGEDTDGASPVAMVMETVCSEEMDGASPVATVTEMVRGEDTDGATPVATVTETVCSEEMDGASPVAMVIETVCSEETDGASLVATVTEMVRGEDTDGATLVATVTETVCSEDTVGASPVAMVTETVRSEETDSAGPVAMVMETVCSEELDGAGPVAKVTETVCSEEMGGAGPVAMVTEMARGEGAITKQEEIVHMVTNDKIVQDQIKTMQKVVDAHEPVLSIAVDVGTEMSGSVCEEMMSVVSRVREQGTKEQIVEMLTSPKEVVQQQSNIVELSKETIQTSITERTVIEVVKNIDTEIGDKFEVAHLEGAVKETHVELQSETGIIAITQVGREVDQYLTKEDTMAMLSKEKFEVLPDGPIGKTVTIEFSATEVVESEAKDHETLSCVTDKPQSIATEEAVDTNENVSLQQESEVVELVQKVGDELPAVEKDQPTPEIEFESAHADVELVQLDGAGVVVPKQCEASAKADEAQKGDGVELANGATEKHLSNLESSGELCSSEASAEGCTEEPKLEVVPESEGVTLGSEIKLYSGSIDEFQTVQNETVTLTTEPYVAESSESREVAFPVTAAAVEEQVIAETVGSVVTQLPELRAVDQLIPAAEPDVILHGPVVETAAAIVEVAIDAAAGTLADSAVESEVDSTVDGQKQLFSSTEQLIADLVNHRTEGEEQKLASLEMETDVEVSQTRTMEQSSTMITEDPMKGVMKSTEITEGQVDPVSSEQDKDSKKMYKDVEEKMPEVQMISTEEKDDEIDDSVQTQDSKGTEALEQKVVVVHTTELVSEKTIEGDQKPLETEDMASVEMERETNESVLVSDGSKVTEVECCESLKTPEGRPPSLELTEEKGQSVKASQQVKEQTSKAADEKSESDVMESIGHKNDKESDKNQTIEAVEKQESQEMQSGHQMDQSSTLERVKAAAEQTTS
ncbi:A-kinase anchor protein 12-like isoform X2 [Stegostoma tigrinum]|uniref:A-kinase anchor protein 12-like isoform X2 n=1 Tax=Stegostoma tigrinum TaxID=3053191 RepID=UPI00287097EE|nr:A-kinase anchor protein 12-like isoform X2 [Stegostoma tigrinum]